MTAPDTQHLPDNWPEMVEALDEALALILAGRPADDYVASRPDLAEALVPMLDVAQMVSAMAATRAPAGARARVRGLVMAAAELQLDRRSPWARLIETLLAGSRNVRVMPVALALALVLLVATAGGTTLVASASALPGSPLYSLKLATEDAQVALTRLTSGPESEALLQSELADRRIDEARLLLEQGKAVPAEVVEAAGRHSVAAEATASQIPESRRVAVSSRLSTAGTQRQQSIDQIAAQVPAPAATAVSGAWERGKEQAVRAAAGTAAAKSRVNERPGAATPGTAGSPATNGTRREGTPSRPTELPGPRTGIPSSGPAVVARGNEGPGSAESRSGERSGDGGGSPTRTTASTASGATDRVEKAQDSSDRSGQATRRSEDGVPSTAVSKSQKGEDADGQKPEDRSAPGQARTPVALAATRVTSSATRQPPAPTVQGRSTAPTRAASADGGSGGQNTPDTRAAGSRSSAASPTKQASGNGGVLTRQEDDGSRNQPSAPAAGAAGASTSRAQPAATSAARPQASPTSTPARQAAAAMTAAAGPEQRGSDREGSDDQTGGEDQNQRDERRGDATQTRPGIQNDRSEADDQITADRRSDQPTVTGRSGSVPNSGVATSRAEATTAVSTGQPPAAPFRAVPTVSPRTEADDRRINPTATPRSASRQSTSTAIATIRRSTPTSTSRNGSGRGNG